MLAQAMNAPGLEVTDVTWIDHAPGSSLITELTARADRRKTTGIFPVRVAWRRDDADGSTDLVLKVKPLDQEVIIEAAKLASLCGGQVADLYPRWRDWTGFTGLHTRELAVYRHAEPALRAVLPRAYGVHEDAAREAYVIAMERLGPGVLHLDSAGTPEQWRPEHLAAAVRGIAGVHAAFLGRHDELRAWLGPVQSAERMTAMRELWGALLEHAATEHPELVDAASARRLRRIVEEIPRWWGRLESMPRTLVHNDFNPRNIALRSPTPTPPALTSPAPTRRTLTRRALTRRPPDRSPSPRNIRTRPCTHPPLAWSPTTGNWRRCTSRSGTWRSCWPSCCHRTPASRGSRSSSTCTGRPWATWASRRSGARATAWRCGTSR
ncbi:phosphotransferase [Nonomuraea thailandensis]